MPSILNEKWLPVPGHPNYEVSDYGRVRSVDHEALTRGGFLRKVKGRILRPAPNKNSGHLTVVLGRGNTRTVHHLVAIAFLGPRPPGHEVRHLDGDPANNVLGNLQWSTRKRNAQDRKYHAGHLKYKLSPEDVRYIKTRLASPYWGLGVELAREFDISEAVISKIKLGQLHTDVLLDA